MAKPYPTSPLPHEYPATPRNTQQDNDRANTVVALVILAALIIAGIAYAYYHNAHKYDNETNAVARTGNSSTYSSTSGAGNAGATNGAPATGSAPSNATSNMNSTDNNATGATTTTTPDNTTSTTTPATGTTNTSGY